MRSIISCSSWDGSKESMQQRSHTLVRWCGLLLMLASVHVYIHNINLSQFRCSEWRQSHIHVQRDRALIMSGVPLMCKSIITPPYLNTRLSPNIIPRMISTQVQCRLEFCQNFRTIWEWGKALWTLGLTRPVQYQQEPHYERGEKRRCSLGVKFGGDWIDISKSSVA